MRTYPAPRDRMVDFLLGALEGDLLAVEVKVNHQGVQAYIAPVTLKQVAQAAKVQSPTAFAHLRRLEEEGRVAKVHTSDGPRYAILPFLKVEWQDPTTQATRKWVSNTPADWRFPLVSRVPDAPAQQFLLRWLDLLLAKNHLPALRPHHPQVNSKLPPLVDFIVYGSCARGDAKARSDIDILVLGDLSSQHQGRIVDAAHEASLGTGRSPDIKAMTLAAWRKAEATLRTNIETEGITIYAADPAHSPFAAATK